MTNDVKVVKLEPQITHMFNVITESSKKTLNATFFPCILFFDDSVRNFAKKPNYVYGVIIKSSLYDIKYDPPLLTKNAMKMWENYDFQRIYDATSGVSMNAFRELKKNLPHPYVSQIVLDWDLTLSVHRAIHRECITKPKKYIAAECYFGGLERMAEIKRFFRHAYWKRIKVTIITSNPVAKTNPEILKLLLSTVYGKWIPVIYSSSKMKCVETIKM